MSLAALFLFWQMEFRALDRLSTFLSHRSRRDNSQRHKRPNENLQLADCSEGSNISALKSSFIALRRPGGATNLHTDRPTRSDCRVFIEGRDDPW